MTKVKGSRLVRYLESPQPAAEAWQLREGEDIGPGQYAASQGQSYDLLERTAVFGESVIRFAKRIPQNPVTKRLIEQLVGCGTSVGANYCEADDAVSRKDFRHKIGICRKEAKETKFFIRMVVAADEELKPEAQALWQEAKELHLIFSKIYWKTPRK